MIYVLVELQVKDFTALETFEKKAFDIMATYGGKLLTAFEVERDQLQGREIHVLSFPDEDCFQGYVADASLKALSALRGQAITSTKVTVSTTVKSYS